MRVSSPVRLTGLALVISSLFAMPVLAQTPPMAPDIGAKLVMPDVNDYVKRVVMIPMRDGVKLYTVIVVPKGAQKAPIMLTRTPYNAARRAQRAASPSMLATLPLLSGTFFTSQSMVSHASVTLSTLVWFSGPRTGRVIT